MRNWGALGSACCSTGWAVSAEFAQLLRTGQPQVASVRRDGSVSRHLRPQARGDAHAAVEVYPGDPERVRREPRRLLRRKAADLLERATN